MSKRCSSGVCSERLPSAPLLLAVCRKLLKAPLDRLSPAWPLAEALRWKNQSRPFNNYLKKTNLLAAYTAENPQPPHFYQQGLGFGV